MNTNSSNWDFRINTASYEDIVLHLNGCASNFVPPLNTYVNIADYARKIREHAITFEAWDKDTLVGLIAAYFNNTATKVGYITNVSVLPVYEGRGIASSLLERTITYGIRHDFHKIELEVNPFNDRAIFLYKRFGFKCVRVIEKNGLRLVLMEREFIAPIRE